MKTRLFLAVAVLLMATLACGLPSTNALFKDDFSDCESGWASQQDEDGITDCENGAYRMMIAVNNYFFWTAPGENYNGDVVVQAEATKTAGAQMGDIGLICRYDESQENFYFLTMSFDGYAAIGLWMGTDYSLLAESGDNNFGSEWNTHTLRAECVGSTMTLYVDNALILSAQDTTLGSGDAGLLIGAYDEPGLDVLFDNFSVTKP